MSGRAAAEMVLGRLSQALSEQNAVLLDGIFYLLATAQDPAAVRTIAQALRSPEPRVRVTAVEALESLAGSQTTALIAPRFEGDPSPEQF